MGWQFLLPIAGSAGVIYAVASVSQTNQRTEKPALTEATHEWKVKADEISAKLSCSGAEEEFNNSELSWAFSLSDEELSQIYKGQTVNKEVDLKLVSKDKQILWPKEWTGVRVHPSKAGSSLSVNYTKAKNTGTQGNHLVISQTGYENSKIVCTWEGLKPMEETEIYRVGMQLGRERLFADSNTKKLSLNIALGDCVDLESGKATQCNFKVTTKGVDVDWSGKVNAKTLLSLKQ